jgi:hypothetical protein
MKTSIRFTWDEDGSLLDRLSQPFGRLSIEQDIVQRPVAVGLHHKSEMVTEICSKMHDIAPRVEIGALEFSTRIRQSRNALAVELRDGVGHLSTIEKLVIVEGDTEVESGIVFTYSSRSKITIVASAAPYVLAIGLPWEVPRLRFNPEYPLERYHRVPMR